MFEKLLRGKGLKFEDRRIQQALDPWEGKERKRRRDRAISEAYLGVVA